MGEFCAMIRKADIDPMPPDREVVVRIPGWAWEEFKRYTYGTGTSKVGTEFWTAVKIALDRYCNG